MIARNGGEPMLVDGGLEILDESECRRLLKTGYLGRIGVTIEALPAIFPGNYTVHEDSILFCTAPGTKLSMASDRRLVAFEVEGGIDAMYHHGWSVLVVGTAREVDNPGELRRLERHLPTPWAPGQRRRVVRIGIDLISGRRIDHGW